MVNYFLETFGYRKPIDPEEAASWKKEGIKYNKKDLPTMLRRANVDAEMVVKDVLLRNMSGFGVQAPAFDLLLTMKSICPDADFADIRRKATRVCAGINTAAAKKRKEKPSGFIDVPEAEE